MRECKPYAGSNRGGGLSLLRTGRRKIDKFLMSSYSWCSVSIHWGKSPGIELVSKDEFEELHAMRLGMLSSSESSLESLLSVGRRINAGMLSSSSLSSPKRESSDSCSGAVATESGFVTLGFQKESASESESNMLKLFVDNRGKTRLLGLGGVGGLLAIAGSSRARLAQRSDRVGSEVTRARGAAMAVGLLLMLSSGLSKILETAVFCELRLVIAVTLFVVVTSLGTVAVASDTGTVAMWKAVSVKSVWSKRREASVSASENCSGCVVDLFGARRGLREQTGE